MQLVRVVMINILLCCTGSVQAQKIPSWKMDEVVNRFNKKNDTVYVINFWATFCRPCVAEIPYIQSISKKYSTKKVKLLLVSLDMKEYYPAKIAAFAKKKNINAEIIWLNETNADHFCPMIDKSWSGAIPATIIVNAQTGYKKFFEEEMKADQFEQELVKAINQ